ncbi:ABC transporter ATP-binding protein [Pseudomonas luteola]|uniref:ABC transporter ATP-binding protein n=1 Tax=Pseudomonas luteola TaxID=47886 RepID=UPI001EF72C03|nr:ABC transporter ATP-binding protein [Pseudomonas luteola]MCG7371685.1 ABC transporter ATP-binding protein [Pseudomonas luteola]
MKLQLTDIRVNRGGRLILSLDQLRLAGNELTVILGHNGSGKSTLMNLLARQTMPDSGRIELDDQPIARLSQREFARQIAFLPQRLPEVAGLTVRELVRLGRFPWRGLLGRWQREDQTIIERAMQQTDVAHYADHLTDTLSGGERQRAWIAMLLAQESPLILLDEPTSALDLSHQYELMGLLHELNQRTGRGIVVILHDINLATRYADRIVALKQGRLFFDGTPQALLSSRLLSELYEIDIQLIEQPAAQRKIAVVA